MPISGWLQRPGPGKSAGFLLSQDFCLVVAVHLFLTSETCNYCIFPSLQQSYSNKLHLAAANLETESEAHGMPMYKGTEAQSLQTEAPSLPRHLSRSLPGTRLLSTPDNRRALHAN